MAHVTLSLICMTLAVLLHVGNTQLRGTANISASRGVGRLDLGVVRSWRNGKFKIGGFMDTRGNWRGRADFERSWRNGKFRTGGSMDNKGNWRARADFERSWRNINFRAGGSVDYRGNFAAKVGFRLRFKREFGRESATWNGEHFNLVIAANPCYFGVYDTNGDGAITKEDINVVFDDEELADKFFSDLDITTGSQERLLLECDPADVRKR